MKINLEDIFIEGKKFILQNGDYVYNNWDKLIIESEKDAGSDVSTNFDKKIEKDFRDLMLSKFPQIGIRGEEFEDFLPDSEYVWNIDPIDGTKFFAKGIPFWSITISLLHFGKPILGLVYNPVSKQLYSAIKGGGAFLNDKKIFVSEETDLAKLQVNFDLALGKNDFVNESLDVLEIFSNLAKNCYRIRMIGNGAYSLAWLAQGLFGVYVDVMRHERKLVDVQAGFLLALEAGAEIYEEDLGDGYKRFVVARKEVLEEVLRIINNS